MKMKKKKNEEDRVSINSFLLPRYTLLNDSDVSYLKSKNINIPSNYFGPNDIDTIDENGVSIPVLKRDKTVILQEVPHLHFDENQNAIFDDDIVIIDKKMYRKDDNDIRVYHYDDPEYQKIVTKYETRPTDPILAEDDIFQKWLEDNSPTISSGGTTSVNANYWTEYSKQYMNAYKRHYNQSKIDDIRDCIDLCYDYCPSNSDDCTPQERYIIGNDGSRILARDSDKCKPCFDDNNKQIFKGTTYKTECKSNVNEVGKKIGCFDVNKNNFNFVDDIVYKSHVDENGNFREDYLINRDKDIKIIPDKTILKITSGGSCLDINTTIDELKELFTKLTLKNSNTLLQNNTTALDSSFEKLLKVINENNIPLDVLSNMTLDYIKATISTTYASGDTKMLQRVTIDDDFIDNIIKYVKTNNSNPTTSAIVNQDNTVIGYGKFKYNVEEYNCNPMFTQALLQNRVPVDDNRRLVEILRS